MTAVTLTAVATNTLTNTRAAITHDYSTFAAKAALCFNVHEVDTIVSAGGGVVGERVGHANDICGIHALLDFFNREPAHR
jgi:hypothetical protein